MDERRGEMVHVSEALSGFAAYLNDMVVRVTGKEMQDWEDLWLERRRKLHNHDRQEWRWVASVIGPRDIRELRRHMFTSEQTEQWARRYGTAEEFEAREVDVSMRGMYCPETDKQIKTIIGWFLNWEK